MSRRCKKRRVMAEMNVVPYIDVMLVLLVIFMVTAPMMQAGVQVDLPDANASILESDSSQAPLFIAVDAAGDITLENGTEVLSQLSDAELSQQVALQLGDKPATRPVYIRADSQVAYKRIMEVMVAAQQAGAKKIGLMAEPPVKQDQ